MLLYILEMENIVKRFGKNTVVDDVTLRVMPGEIISVIGASGAGKSTLLRCVNQLELINSGRIVIDSDEIVKTDASGRVRYLKEKRLRAIRSKTSMVFQHFNLFPHLTCLENVTITGIRIRKQPAADVIARGKRLLDSVGLSDKADVYPAKLSGGQKQRVAIARTLALDPVLMLFDEPTSSLDPEITGEVLSVMRELVGKRITMIIVTHEIGFAREVSNRMIYMDGGRIIEEGDPKVIASEPKTERLRAFLSAVL